VVNNELIWMFLVLIQMCLVIANNTFVCIACMALMVGGWGVRVCVMCTCMGCRMIECEAFIAML